MTLIRTGLFACLTVLLVSRAGHCDPVIAAQYQDRPYGKKKTPVLLHLGYQQFRPEGVSRSSYWRDYDLSQTGALPMLTGDISWSPVEGRVFGGKRSHLGLFASLAYAERLIPLAHAASGRPAGSAVLQNFVSLMGIEAGFSPLSKNLLNVALRSGLGTMTYLRKTNREEHNDTLDGTIYSLGFYSSWLLFRPASLFLEYDYRALMNQRQRARMNVQNHNVIVGVELAI